MTKATRLLIAACIFALLSLGLIFGLGRQKEEYLIIGLFSGIAAAFCGIATVDAKAGKRSNLIFMGICMTAFATMFVLSYDLFPRICTVTAAVFGLCGLLLFVLGIVGSVKARKNRSPEDKRPINAMMYVGMALILAGIIGTVVLYELYARLVLLAILLILVGIVVLTLGNSRRKKGKKKAEMTTEDFNLDEIEIVIPDEVSEEAISEEITENVVDSCEDTNETSDSQ